jgi:hypothetical protein
MNAPQLIEHGIQNEESDYRIHVGFKRTSSQPRMVYVFSTAAGRAALNHPSAEPFTAAQQSVSGITGKGVKVRWNYIEGCREIQIPGDIFLGAHYDPEDDTSARGRSAVYVVKEMLKRGLIQFPALVQEITDRDMQIKGTDLTIAACSIKLQIKCDAWATDYGLRLQTAECNPLKRF